MALLLFLTRASARLMDFTDLIDLASERVGGAVLLANDEFFAPKENLLKPTAAEWREGAYTERGTISDQAASSELSMSRVGSGLPSTAEASIEQDSG